MFRASVDTTENEDSWPHKGLDAGQPCPNLHPATKAYEQIGTDSRDGGGKWKGSCPRLTISWRDKGEILSRLPLAVSGTRSLHSALESRKQPLRQPLLEGVTAELRAKAEAAVKHQARGRKTQGRRCPLCGQWLKPSGIKPGQLSPDLQNAALACAPE